MEPRIHIVALKRSELFAIYIHMSHCADVYIIPRAARDFDLFPKKKLDSGTCTTTCTAVQACGKEQLDFYVPYPTCSSIFVVIM